MKEIIGFSGRTTFVYGVSILVFFVTSETNTITAWIIGAVAWMFVFYFITQNWEDWGSTKRSKIWVLQYK